MRRDFSLATKQPAKWPFLVLFIVSILYIVWFIQLSQGANQLFDQANAAQKAAQVNYTQAVHLGKNQPSITLLASDPFHIGTRWMYVSKWHEIPKNYVPADLVDITVPQAASDKPFELTSQANTALAKLFTAAEKAGHQLVVSSAYRSADDQRVLRDQTIAAYGQAYADEYIAEPGTSEHQTGLAVDINTYSSACTQDANSCAISAETAAWLRANAPNYGFILRYPEGKADVTGISHEPWHFRYIGPEAKAITNSGLVYDQIVKKVEPNLIK